MNKKGFAVSVILYSIIFLIITTLFMLLGIMKTRFTVNNDLRENILETINDEIGVGVIFSSSDKCIISANSIDYTDNLILTMNVENGSLFSWDNETYSVNNTIKVNRAGTYNGFFKDKAGGNGECKEVNIISRTKYSNRECDNINYGEWYWDSEENVSVCPSNLKEKIEAEAENTNGYCTCTDSECRIYRRNPIGCNVWGQWYITDSYEETSAIKESKSITTYKVK